MAKKNEQKEFLENVDDKKQTVDQLEAPLEPEDKTDVTTEADTEVDPEQVPDDIKNRRHRRLERKLQAEREANIAMAARLAERDKMGSKGTSEADALIDEVERIYGSASPEAIEATRILKSTLQGVEKRATETAIKALREERAREAAEVQKSEAELDSMVEDIEDEYGVTLTPDQQRGFFKMLERLSPKDEDGNIVAYADPDAVWESYQAATTKKPSSTAKNLSDRSMVPSGASGGGQNLTDKATEDFLKSNGII